MSRQSREHREHEVKQDELLAEGVAALERLASAAEREANRPPRVRLPDIARDPYAEYDLLGRKQPHKMRISNFVRAIPHLASYFTGQVPATSVTQPEAFESRQAGVAVVQCPCGASTEVPHDSAVNCSGECSRMFWNFAGRVRVAYDRE